MNDLFEIPETDLEAQLSAFGLLKGHAIKLKCSIDSLRTKSKPTVTSTNGSSKSLLQKETEQLLQKRAEVEQVRDSIARSRAMILNVDIGNYRKILESIGTLQETMRQMEEVEMAEEEKTMDYQ